MHDVCNIRGFFKVVCIVVLAKWSVCLQPGKLGHSKRGDFVVGKQEAMQEVKVSK